MIENNPESAAGSCQETGAGGHAGDDESDACRCPQCGAPAFRIIETTTVDPSVAALVDRASPWPKGRGRSTLEILADHWPRPLPAIDKLLDMPKGGIIISGK